MSPNKIASFAFFSRTDSTLSTDIIEYTHYPLTLPLPSLNRLTTQPSHFRLYHSLALFTRPIFVAIHHAYIWSVYGTLVLSNWFGPLLGLFCLKNIIFRFYETLVLSHCFNNATNRNCKNSLKILWPKIFFC